MQFASEMSEIISDVFGQWRRRTITASSRRFQTTAPASRMSTLHGGDGGGGGGGVREENVLCNEASSFLPVGSQISSHEDSSISRSLRSNVSSHSSKNVNSRCRQSDSITSKSNSSDRHSITKSVVATKSNRRLHSNNGNGVNSKKVLYSKSNSCANSSKSVFGFNLVSVILAQTLILMCSVCCSSKVYNVHWNTSNPIFRIDNTDHIIDVNRDNLPYDQVNIICPVYQPGTKEEDAEKYIIYNVSKEEYDTCRITNPNPRIIAVCDKPFKLMYFTITFRSFTPQPGGLEFRPGQDYYFISTSSRDDLHRRVGGRCSTHNMKVVFKVCCHPGETSSQSSTSAPALPQIPRFSTPRASTASSATLSPRRPLIVYNSSSASASNPNNMYGSRINNGTSIISNNDHFYPRTQDPLYNSNNIGGGGYGGSSSSSSSPASTSTTNIPPQPFPAHPPVTRYPPKKTQYTNNPNYKPPSKKKELEKHPNEVVKNEELTSGAASSSLTAVQTTTLLFLTLSTILVTRRIQSPVGFHWFLLLR